MVTSKYQYGKHKKELSTTVDMLTQFDDDSIKDELYSKMKKLGKELDSVKAEIKDIEREIELYSAKPDITRTRINRELEDLWKLQSGLNSSEKREILAMVVDKIVLKTEIEHSKLSRTMSITIYVKDEFASRIPPLISRNAAAYCRRKIFSPKSSQLNTAANKGSENLIINKPERGCFCTDRYHRL